MNTEEIELFEDLFRTSPKIQNQLTEDARINYFHSLMRGDALQTFKNISGPTQDNLGEILAVFRWNYIKPQSMSTAKYKFQKLDFNPANQKLVDFLDELDKLARDAFGIAAHAIIEQFIHAKMPPHLKNSMNPAHLENGTYEQIVTHLERELELNGLEAPDELPINNVSQQPTNTNADRPKPTCHHFNSPDITEISVALSENSQNKLKMIKLIPETKTVPPIPLIRTVMSTTTKTTKTVIKLRESRKLFTHPVGHAEKQTTPQRNVILEPMQPIDRLLGTEDQKDRIGSQKEPTKVTLMKLPRLQPKI